MYLFCHFTFSLPLVTDLIFQHAIFPCQERVSSCLSFIPHLKIHRRHEPPSLSLSCRLSMFLSGTDLWLAVVSLPGTLFRNTTSPWVPPRWHWRWPTVGTALAECVPPFVAQRTGWSWHRVALLSQPSSPRCPGVNWHHSTRHQTARQRPACPRMSWNTGADCAS